MVPACSDQLSAFQPCLTPYARGDLQARQRRRRQRTRQRRGLAAGLRLSSGSDSGEEENIGQWSPAALDPALVATGQDVVHEDEEARTLDLMPPHVRAAANWSSYVQGVAASWGCC